MKIHLIRHGQTMANADKKYLGSGSSPFTALGLEQNADALSKLAQVEIDAVYSSPSDRCMSSANSFAACKKTQVISDARLSEIDFGKFEGLTWQEAEKNYPSEFKEFCEDPQNYVFPEGESQKRLDERTLSFIEEIKRSSYESIAVFSHGGTIMSILSHLLEIEPHQKWRFKITHGSVSLVEIKGGYACLVL